MEMLNGTSMNLTQYNIDIIEKVFPEVVNEGKIDFEKLRLVLGDTVEEREERYEFNWNGKNNAIKIAQTPSTGTLRTDRDSSKNWDDTENLYIEGDNLEVLKLLQKSYFGKIKIIYIDPPYNTGNDFVYKDNFRDSIANYKEITSQATKSNSETNGRYHTDWLNMIYPRLKLAKNLLKEDGVIFISIDDNEIDNLKKVCDEIFGEINKVSTVVWKRKRGRDNSAKWFSKSHEYLLVYAKNKDNFNVNFLELDEDTLRAYKNPDNDKRGAYRMLGTWARGSQGGVEYDFINKHGQYFSKRLWLFSKEKLNEMDIEDKLVVRGDNIYRKLFLDENKGKIPETIWDNVSNGANACDELKRLFNNIVFDTPKPIPYILEVLKISSNKEDIILDFFSGSSTTADAVMRLNFKDRGYRKYIMVQLQEQPNEKSVAYKAGYKNICEIGKERIRRAGDNIVSENKDKKGIENLDIGFKVFKLDSSNLKLWDTSIENLEQNLLDMESNLKEDRTSEDLLYEILLKSGIELTAKIEEIKVGYNTLYNIGEGALLVCLDDKITQDVIDEIPKHKSQFMETKVIFKEAGFMSDAAKVNAIQNLKQFEITDIRSV